MRIVVDTNVLISGVFFGGFPRQILNAVVESRLTACATTTSVSSWKKPSIRRKTKIYETHYRSSMIFCAGSDNRSTITWLQLLGPMQAAIRTDGKICVYGSFSFWKMQSVRQFLTNLRFYIRFRYASSSWAMYNILPDPSGSMTSTETGCRISERTGRTSTAHGRWTRWK